MLRSKSFTRHRSRSAHQHIAIGSLEARCLLAAHVVGDATVYQTIQAAVDAAAPGGIVNVDAGTYSELVRITKSLTVRGAEAGIDARSNARSGAAESILTGVDLGVTRSSSFYIAANDVTIDGFTVQGNTSNGTYGAGIVIAPNQSGAHILNNIVQNNIAGLYLANASSTDPAVIQHNVFAFNNNAGANGGRGIYTDDTVAGNVLTNVLIDGNYFYRNNGGTGTTGYESAISFESRGPARQSNITIANNVFDYNGKAVLMWNAQNIAIRNNVITNERDQWSAALRFEGGVSNVSITGNTAYDNTAPAVRIDSKAYIGDNSAFAITGNNFYSNSRMYTNKQSLVVATGQYTGPLDATGNWWGDATGPSGDGAGSGDAVVSSGTDVRFSGWATSFVGNAAIGYYGLPSVVGAPIEAEAFDHGGDGLGYHDPSAGNTGNQFRPVENVDIEATGDVGGGYDVGWAQPGEWLDYTISVPAAGAYRLDVRLSNGQTTGGTFHAEIDGQNVTGALVSPVTGGWQVWQTFSAGTVTLTAGTHVLRVVTDLAGAGGYGPNFNWFNLVNAAPVPAPAAPSGLVAAAANPTTVNLAWADNSNNETGFVIERMTGTGAWGLVATVGPNVTTYIDSPVSPSTAYRYRVRATSGSGSGDSDNSNEAAVTTPALPTTTYLSDLPFVGVPTNGWGPVEPNQSNGSLGAGDGSTLALNGVTYAKGLGCHAYSEVTYNLAGNYATFLSDIGIDDEVGTNGSVTFQVWADGAMLYQSPVMTGASPTASVSVDVTGRQQLKLIVTDGGDGMDYDHADWAGARLMTATTGAPAAPTNLLATAVSPTMVYLTWADNSNNESGFAIERQIGGVWSALTTAAANATSYVDSPVLPNTAYSYRVRATGGSGSGDSANSNEAAVTTPALPTTTFLSDMTFASVPVNGWGPVERDLSNGSKGTGDGRTITLNGVTYAKGLGCHANSQITFNLGGNYSAFSSDVGVDDEQGTNGSVTFQVWADGVKLYDSGLMTGISPTQSINVSVAGKQQLQLVVTDGGDGIDYDHADWAGARLQSGVLSPPATPTNLQATAASSTLVNLTWTGAADANSFRIERRTGLATAWDVLQTVGASVRNFADSAVLPNTLYTYHIVATNLAGDSVPSTEAAITTPAPPALTYVSDLPFLGTPVNGWGPVERDTSNGSKGAGDGRTITLNGVTYAKGLGCHANSQITFNLAGNYTTFVSDVGVDDEQGTNGSVVFQVWADGVKLYDSGLMTGVSATQSVSVSVAGKQQLQLVVTDGGNGIDFDHADWAGARLLV